MVGGGGFVREEKCCVRLGFRKGVGGMGRIRWARGIWEGQWERRMAGGKALICDTLFSLWDWRFGGKGVQGEMLKGAYRSRYKSHMGIESGICCCRHAAMGRVLMQRASRP